MKTLYTEASNWMADKYDEPGWIWAGPVADAVGYQQYKTLAEICDHCDVCCGSVLYDNDLADKYEGDASELISTFDDAEFLAELRHSVEDEHILKEIDQRLVIAHLKHQPA
ncbi:MAG: hypothetical protein K0U53_06685 [Betaproteobacteria bacterium]|nr:hypothetical protein [Betaproteobacteria bacterium]